MPLLGRLGPFRFVVVGLAIAGGALLGLTLAERAVWADDVLPGVRLAGVSLGGTSFSGAAERVSDLAGALEDESLAATAAGRRFTFTPADAGLDVDEGAALAALRRAGRSGNLGSQLLGVVRRRLDPVDVEWEVSYDDKALVAAVEGWAEEVDSAPVDGSVKVEGATVVAADSRDGIRLDKAGAADAVRDALAGRARPPLELAVERTPAAVQQTEVDATAAEARRVLDGPVTVVVDGREIPLRPAELGEVVVVNASGGPEATAAERGDLTVDLPAGALHKLLVPHLAGLESPARDARFVVEYPPPPPAPTPPPASTPPDPGAPPPAEAAAPTAPLEAPPPPAATVRIEESANGRGLDAEPVARALLAGTRRIEGTLVDIAPALDTARAQSLRIHEEVSTFTTNHPAGQPRVQNIHRIADMVQDTLVEPGRTFSLNEKVGPRTRAAGFVKAPVIYDGEFTEDVGGGVSQFATTFFNTAFFGGYEIVSHKAHSYYISRYPQGREATISFPQPDLVIKNDSTSGILVRTSYTGSSITVTFFGDKEGKTVRAVGPRVGKKAGSGYRVEVTRVIERPGQPTIEQPFVTFYRIQRRATPPPKPVTPDTPSPAALPPAAAPPPAAPPPDSAPPAPAPPPPG